MKPITTNIYTFEDLITGGNLYVDKTRLIHGLVSVNKGQFFLSRPRRFGKSLLISTLKAIFQGKRHLFDGLAIDSLPYDWAVHPVIHLDMGSMHVGTPADLTRKLLLMLRRIARENGISPERLPADGDASDVFMALVEALNESSGGKGVVILVDEYDKPLLGLLGKPKEVVPVRDVLKAFYSVIKTTESKQRFAFITGVSKFSKVSIFSDLNNLTDLTMSASAATLLGYTADEVKANFAEGIADLATVCGMTDAQAFAELELMYDGFRFHYSAPSVFNPVSLGNCLIEKEFKNYWFETGTPTFLIELLKVTPLRLDNLEAAEDDFSVYEVENPLVMPLLVQTGYLTIKSFRMEGRRRIYTLAYPNVEIADSFNKWLLGSFSGTPGNDQETLLSAIVRSLRENDVGEMMEAMKVFFASIPNTIVIQKEKYYQTIFFAIFQLVGASIEAEVSTNIGRIDAVVKTESRIFVMEFKLRDTADAALAQIKEKKYAQKYALDRRPLTLVGVAFDLAERNITEFREEPL